eukprot:TRINITY_DN2442_c0_g1_i2.p1 TRINITY_DN2442_c0_g1~~TRINITY_DN2442_c0_g1_i2.p1  ORF type:complete len:353 (+),score=51.34 TRINITY_DN2442_c0_g1_i2:151-1209(+)
MAVTRSSNRALPAPNTERMPNVVIPSLFVRTYRLIASIIMFIFLSIHIVALCFIVWVWVVVGEWCLGYSTSKRFWLANRLCTHSNWLLITFVLWWTGCRVKVTSSSDELNPRPNETVIFLCNHRSLIDWVPIYWFGLPCGRTGCCKFFAKEILKHLPGFGWGMRLLSYIFLKRNWTKDADSIRAVFAHILSNRHLPYWIVIFAEGTRLTAKNMKESQEFCKKTGRPVLHNLLYPRTKGFVATIKAMKEKDGVDAIYDVTLGFENNWAPSVGEACTNEKGNLNMSMNVNRYALSDLPDTDAEIEKWCIDRFIEKDALIDAYLENNNEFPGKRLAWVPDDRTAYMPLGVSFSEA